MKIRAFITHKKVEQFQDCQDRFCVNSDTKSVAVSDGMSQSIFQKIWAEILVDAYTNNSGMDKWCPSQESNQETIKTKLTPAWKERVHNRILEMQKEGQNTLRAENSLAVGLSAGATLAGVRFDNNKWIGEVMGDSCIIEISGTNIAHIYTSQEVEAFDNHPDYFDSNPTRQGKGTPKQFDGELQQGMALLIVSDPFSDFLFEKQKTGKESEYVKELLAIDSHETFENTVTKWRADYGMHNDDSTLLIIEPDNSTEWTILSDDINQLIETDVKASTAEVPHNPFPSLGSGSATSEKMEETVEETNNLLVNLSDARKRCEEIEKEYKDLEEEYNKLKEECMTLREEQKEWKEWQNRKAKKSDIFNILNSYYSTQKKFSPLGTRKKHNKEIEKIITFLCSKFDFYKK